MKISYIELWKYIILIRSDHDAADEEFDESDESDKSDDDEDAAAADDDG